jgi:hypothetical protein
VFWLCVRPAVVLCGCVRLSRWHVALHRHSSSNSGRRPEGVQSFDSAVCKACTAVLYGCVGQGRWHAALHRRSSSRRHPEGEQDLKSMGNSMSGLQQYCMVVSGWAGDVALHRHSSSRRHPKGEQSFARSLCNRSCAHVQTLHS